MRRHAASGAPFRVFNIGNHAPVDLLYFIETLEPKLGRKAAKNFLPIQAGDVPATYADTDALASLTGFTPRTSVEEGIARFGTGIASTTAFPEATAVGVVVQNVLFSYTPGRPGDIPANRVR
jgi:UDP-glucuronate 4-epimerase